MKVRITEPAEKDLEKGTRFYERQTPGLGEYFLDSLSADIDSLAYFAGIHRTLFGCYRLLAKRFPFAIYYKIKNDEAIVLAVLDCRQNPARIEKRLSGNS